MSTGSERPKRRAASSNINYKETTETEPFDTKDNSKSSKRQKKSSANSTNHNNNNSGDTNKGVATQSSANSNKDQDTTGAGDDNLIPWNWQPPFKESDFFNNHLDLKSSKIENNTLTTKDGFKLSKNDCIYMVSEPPGEPYYIGRILGFTKKDKNLTTKNASNYLFKMNWLYRPRDLNQKSNDSRLLYATMHSDDCPIQSFRGVITLKHRSEITNLDEYRQVANNFYFDKLFDRYMIKYYEILPTINLVNLPPNYYKALNKRYPYVFVEIGRGKDLLSAPKNCEKCFQWCSSMDSVMCINCEKYYHMLCLDPPLMRKPQRGFGWSCALCNKELESKLSKERGQMLMTSSLSKLNSSRNTSVDLEESESMDDVVDIIESKSEQRENLVPKYEELAIQFLEKDKSLSLKQRRNLEEWPYRYLGMHVKLEDAMDLQDRPYARSASRLGSKHQLTGLQEWVGHPIKYYDPDETVSSSQSQSQQKKKKSYYKKKTSPSPSVPTAEENIRKLPLPEEFVNKDPSEFPPWLQERPKGYIERGGDDTATLVWRMPSDITDKTLISLNEYVKRCSPIAKHLKMLPSTPNFMDAILKNYLDFNYDLDLAYEKSSKLTRESLKEPTFAPDEIERFEEGVRKYGSELYPVYQEVKTKSSADIVRFYYLWKKTPNGHKIWDNYEGRAKNKLKNSNKLSNGAVDSVADSADDSSYDSTKIVKAKRKCVCKHCHTSASVQWFRVTGNNKAPTNPEEPIVGLCLRCAKLWRRYALQWEEPLEVLKKNQQRGGNGWKRKIENELLTDAERIIEARNKSASKKSKTTSSVKKEDTKHSEPSLSLKTVDKKSLEVKLNFKKITALKKQEKSKKTVKATAPALPPPPPKKVFKIEPPLSSIPLFETNPNYIYESSRIKTLVQPPVSVPFDPERRSCCVCRTLDNPQDIVICSNCGLNVHKLCYGVSSKNITSSTIWNCDRCLNELNPIYSTNYSCNLCITKNVHYDDMIGGVAHQFPDLLKPTLEDQWCHSICAIFDESCKMGNLNSNSPILNTLISLHQNCNKSCLICKHTYGSFTKCEFCDDQFHVTCAQNLSDVFVGFLLLPCDYKDKYCIKIQDFIYGIPKPVIVCNKHFQQQPLPPQFVPLRIPGKRINSSLKSGSQEQPLISLYVQDYKKNDENVVLKFTETMKPPPVAQKCSNCQTSNSIIFLSLEDKQLCHSCYSNATNPNYNIEKQNYTDYADKAMKLMQLVNSPLPVRHLGIGGGQKDPQQFSKVSINDILS